jgi:hypothetical protein
VADGVAPFDCAWSAFLTWPGALAELDELDADAACEAACEFACSALALAGACVDCAAACEFDFSPPLPPSAAYAGAAMAATTVISKAVPRTTLMRFIGEPLSGGGVRLAFVAKRMRLDASRSHRGATPAIPPNISAAPITGNRREENVRVIRLGQNAVARSRRVSGACCRTSLGWSPGRWPARSVAVLREDGDLVGVQRDRVRVQIVRVFDARAYFPSCRR